jgi:hypothetical protein
MMRVTGCVTVEFHGTARVQPSKLLSPSNWQKLLKINLRYCCLEDFDVIARIDNKPTSSVG